MSAIHLETHQSRNIGWLRAAVLGANDGLISTSSLVVGVAAAQPDRASVVVAALAGLVAGALSMAAGEYVTLTSQSDTEAADLAREQMELATQPEHELAELASIYVSRGLSPALATQVAVELTAHDALGAHARDELGIHDLTRARPVQAALASAAAFASAAFPASAFALAAIWRNICSIVFSCATTSCLIRCRNSFDTTSRHNLAISASFGRRFG